MTSVWRLRVASLRDLWGLPGLRRLLLVASLLAWALALGACTSDDDTPDPGAADTGEAGLSAAEVAALLDALDTAVSETAEATGDLDLSPWPAADLDVVPASSESLFRLDATDAAFPEVVIDLDTLAPADELISGVDIDLAITLDEAAIIGAVGSGGPPGAAQPGTPPPGTATPGPPPGAPPGATPPPGWTGPTPPAGWGGSSD